MFISPHVALLAKSLGTPALSDYRLQTETQAYRPVNNKNETFIFKKFQNSLKSKVPMPPKNTPSELVKERVRNFQTHNLRILSASRRMFRIRIPWIIPRRYQYY